MNTKTLVRAGIAVLSGAVLLAPTAALADTFTDQVRYQLLQAAIALGLSGNFELTHDPYVDSLDVAIVEGITLKTLLLRSWGFRQIGDRPSYLFNNCNRPSLLHTT